MIQLLVFGLLCSATIISAQPVAHKHPPVNYAAVARRLVHQTNWAAVATISTLESLEGFPMASVLSTADSPSTGEIFFYMIGMDLPAVDTRKDNKITFLFTDAQTGICDGEKIDPYGHNCTKAMITGQARQLDEDTEEYKRGYDAFLERHPHAKSWTAARKPGSSYHGPHDFFLCKLDISNVIVFAGYGGYKTITPEEYLAHTDAVETNAAHNKLS